MKKFGERIGPTGRTQILVSCTRCGTKVWKIPSSVRRRKPYCSRHCAGSVNGTLAKHAKGSKCSLWKGGIFNKDHRKYRRMMYRKHHQKWLARARVRYAIKTGRLIRQPCEVCGDTKKIHAHHDDYSKPLQVRWLCRIHHDEVHGKKTK